MAPPNGTHEHLDTAHDLRWARDVRDSLRCAGALLGFLLLLDWGSGRLTLWRGALWFGLALLLLLALYPARISAGDGWLASRLLLREHRVRTDLLVSVRCQDGVSQRLVLRDMAGGRVEIDPEVLVRNPRLWSRLDAGARKSAAAGTLLCGATALSRLSRRVDRETAHAVFRASHLK
ncbi:hypothetical protein [Streptomyces sp. AMCC400023]|uniref:hypothetical protein n=1 Tax=Streptomyces sp. AMCC400023 TaxID=2056258 RepID=UPI001F31DC09|nr:hypothetical protein [Streptomyces sp. AMCC400023]UJV41833.1 hypothetical protein CVT30_20000 [Streptomyces sp. AMCC400023]